MALFNSSEERAAKRQEKFEKKEREIQEKMDFQNKVNSVLITTGDLNVEYEIIDAIFAIQGSEDTNNKGINAEEVFQKVKNGLRLRCVQAGGDAVINCQFEYRNAINMGQVLEIFAYGTAVRL